ncbi:Uncharacterised protein [Mycobacteroides abscessus subsp. abscessus]|uniref:hypothetical protein n=1 Tax=Mycobacteroides abscessus TaxID=36809 RepID=UPI0009A7FE35|nr:hypothetical protein [Mycobacteroides abscessus]SKU67136.1 Uncharacterised protein [Mycobacteroides abscessus subsp. abscessus]
MSASSDAYCDWDDQYGDSVYESHLERHQEEIVLNALTAIPALTDTERENVRHELWETIDAAWMDLELDVASDYSLIDPGEAFWATIDAAVAKGLAYTRRVAA